MRLYKRKTSHGVLQRDVERNLHSTILRPVFSDAFGSHNNHFPRPPNYPLHYLYKALASVGV